MTWEKDQLVSVRDTALYGTQHKRGRVSRVEEGVAWVIFPGCCKTPIGLDTHTLGFYEHELEER